MAKLEKLKFIKKKKRGFRNKKIATFITKKRN